jgi:hypothetical protein
LYLIEPAIGEAGRSAVVPIGIEKYPVDVEFASY